MCKRELKIGLFFYLVLFHLGLNCLAVERIKAVGAREAALSLAVVSLPGSFSAFHNQALLIENSTPSISASFRQPYFISGLAESALTFVYPTTTAVFAFSISQTSIATYKESNYGISIAKGLSGKLSAGLLFNYFNLNFPEESRHKSSFQVDGGIMYKYSRLLSLGLHLQNLVCTKAETFQYSFAFPLVARGGASFQLSERLLLTAESVFEKDIGLGIRCGIEYMLKDNFRLRGGMSTKPFQHSFGFGYNWTICQLDFAMVHHEMLGYTPSFSVSFNLKQDGNHRF